MTNPLPRIVLILFLSLFISLSALAQSAGSITEENIRTELGYLASDEMQGRAAGTTNERDAAAYMASQFRKFGLEPGGDEDAGNKSYIQRIPVQSKATWNVIGILRGTQPGEAIMLSAHLDHLGVNNSLSGDKIYNGADDDASGCVAVLELARVLTSGPRPRRTIYFIGFGAEEVGGYGSQYFINHPPVPLPQIVADLTFEMLGRPDAKVPAGTLWLTGFERSTLGPELARQGAALVADPHPEQHFFQRSDNYPLALRGVIAHTISSFGLHKDYHQPSDDISKIDFPFMTKSLNSLVKPVTWFANSDFKPEWLPGKAPKR